MIKRKVSVLLMLPLILILSACASLNLPGTTAGAGTPRGQNQPGQPFDMSKQPLELKLAIGILKLEGTDKAITEEQAKTLLPLWKGVRALSSDSKTAQTEIDAVYKQIEEAMTADQLEAVKMLSLTPQDTQALMQQYGIRGMRPVGPNQSGTPAAQPQTNGGTNRSSGRSQPGGQGGSFPGGQGFGQGGGFPDGGGFSGGPQSGRQRTPNAQRTPRTGTQNGGFRGGMNFIFIDPLIKVLQERAGIP